MDFLSTSSLPSSANHSHSFCHVSATCHVLFFSFLLSLLFFIVFFATIKLFYSRMHASNEENIKRVMLCPTKRKIGVRSFEIMIAYTFQLCLFIPYYIAQRLLFIFIWKKKTPFLLPVRAARTSVQLAKMEVYSTNLPNFIQNSWCFVSPPHSCVLVLSSIAIAWHVQTINIVWLMRIWECWMKRIGKYMGCGMQHGRWSKRITKMHNSNTNSDCSKKSSLILNISMYDI